MGRRKSYWEYFCECLGSSKGLKDGLKYVKSLKEVSLTISKYFKIDVCNILLVVNFDKWNPLINK